MDRRLPFAIVDLQSIAGGKFYIAVVDM